MPILEFRIPFNCCNCTKRPKNMNRTQNQSVLSTFFYIHSIAPVSPFGSFYRLKTDKFPYSIFFSLQQEKSLPPSLIPEKGTHFRRNLHVWAIVESIGPRNCFRPIIDTFLKIRGKLSFQDRCFCIYMAMICIG